jgi:hypothetical protein
MGTQYLSKINKDFWYGSSIGIKFHCDLSFVYSGPLPNMHIGFFYIIFEKIEFFSSALSHKPVKIVKTF